MGENSAIEWTDHTFNPWMGCTKVSPACDGCYAEALMDLRYGKVLGHSDIAITAKFYTDAPVDDMRAAMETTAAASAPLALPAPDKALGGE